MSNIVTKRVSTNRTERLNNYFASHRTWLICTLVIIVIILMIIFLWINLRQKVPDGEKDHLIPSGSRDGDQDEEQEFNMECVKAHNVFRVKHGVPPVRSSPKLVELAATRVEKLVQLDQMMHLPGNQGYGENLYMVHGSLGDCQQATQSWYDEFDEFQFDFSKPIFTYNTGHATQVVWRETNEIGCAQRSLEGKQIPKQYTVCMYSPAGNMLGEFKQNVPPPK